jgi:hypothetical protein
VLLLAAAVLGYALLTPTLLASMLVTVNCPLYCWQLYCLHTVLLACTAGLNGAYCDSLDKSCNVTDVQECWHLALGLVQVTQPGEAVIWNIHTRLQVQHQQR